MAELQLDLDLDLGSWTSWPAVLSRVRVRVTRGRRGFSVVEAW